MIRPFEASTMPPMNRHTSRLACLLIGVLAGACSTPGGNSAVPAPPEFQPIASGDMLYLWSGGLDALMVDPKDAGVRDALRQLGARLLELPDEMGDPEFPGDALDLAAGLFLGPMSMSVGPSEGEAAADMPVRAQMTFRGASADEARRRADLLTAVLSRYGVPSLGMDEATGLSVLDLGGISVHHGVVRAGRPDTLVVGTDLDMRERLLGTLDLPAGVAPAVAFRMDYGSLSDVLAMFGGPEAAEALREAGVEDLVVQGALGHGADRSFATLRMTDWVTMAHTNGSVPSVSIEREALALIPRDATVAIVARTNLKSITQAMRGATDLGEGMASELAGLDPFAILREFTGVDVETEVVGNLGETVGVYMSDSTGGGGFYSGVAFVRVTDEAALRVALERLEGRIEDYAADEGLPGFALRRAQHADADISTITVSGWPIPIEPSWAIRGGWLFASASFQGLCAALDQAARPESDLLDNDGFRAEVTGSLDDLVSLNYLDVPRFVREGYPVAAMLGSALSNGISSSIEPDRVPAGIVPGYAAFARGARATVALGRIEGEDLVVRSQGDRSLLVQMAGITGAMGPLPLLLVGVAAAGAANEIEHPEGFEIMETEMPADDDEMNAGDAVDENLGIDIDDLITDPPAEDPK